MTLPGGTFEVLGLPLFLVGSSYAVCLIFAYSINVLVLFERKKCKKACSLTKKHQFNTVGVPDHQCLRELEAVVGDVAGDGRVVGDGTRGVAGERSPVAGQVDTRASSLHSGDRTVHQVVVADSVVTSSAVEEVHRGMVPGGHTVLGASKTLFISHNPLK